MESGRVCLLPHTQAFFAKMLLWTNSFSKYEINLCWEGLADTVPPPSPFFPLSLSPFPFFPRHSPLPPPPSPLPLLPSVPLPLPLLPPSFPLPPSPLPPPPSSLRPSPPSPSSPVIPPSPLSPPPSSLPLPSPLWCSLTAVGSSNLAASVSSRGACFTTAKTCGMEIGNGDWE